MMANEDPRQQAARELAEFRQRSQGVPGSGPGVTDTKVPIPAPREPSPVKIEYPPPVGGIPWQEWD
jgi:hypothetical protein